MHDKAPLNVALASMWDCPVFKAACATVAAAALPGVRTPFSREVVQSSLWHGNKSGIYSMLGAWALREALSPTTLRHKSLSRLER